MIGRRAVDVAGYGTATHREQAKRSTGIVKYSFSQEIAETENS